MPSVQRQKPPVSIMSIVRQRLRKQARLPVDLARAQHSASPDVTFARFGGLARTMGITRIGNVTELDDLGIPAFIATRPASLSVAVAMGKGLTPAHARVSALMEAAETFHGEHLDPRFQRASACMLRCSGADLVEPSALWRSPVPYDGTQAIDWIEAVDLGCLRPCWVPAGSVHTERARAEPVLVGSNGLATGNHLLEALSAGLCEVIERDSVALWHARRLSQRAACRLDLGSVGEPSCRVLLDRYAKLGFQPRIWDVTSNIGVATFVCDLPSRTHDHAPTLRRSRGAGCHPEPAVALLRALTEVAQSRLHRIAGLRNDLTAEAYHERPATAAGAIVLDALTDAAPGRSLANTPCFSSDDVGEDVRWLLRRLQARGFGRVLAVDLTRPELGLPAVRVIVPGLEWDDNHPHYRPGARAREAARA